MDITLPTIPAGVLTLLALLAPYAIAIINRPGWSTNTKRVVSIAVAIILAAIVLIGYFLITRDVIPDWPVLVLLTIIVVQASYALITKSTATQLERSTNTWFTAGESLRRDRE